MSKYLELPWSVEDTIENMRELKEVLQKMCITDNLDGRGEKDAEEIAFDFDRAINALEEIQKYRAIGTPEECRAAVEKQKEIKNNAVDDFVERAMKQFTDFDLKHGYPTVTDCKVILRDIAEQMTGSADNAQID